MLDLKIANLVLLCMLAASATRAQSPDQTATVAPTAAVANASGEQLFARAKNTVFRLVTREKGAQSGASHGSAFVVRRNGFLITNFHVVAEVVQHPAKYELVLELPGKSVPAKVMTLDAVNDLALVKVDTVFSDALTLAEPDSSRPGVAAISFGFPKSEALSMTQGNVNGDRTMGFGSVLTASMAINPGMSGGPCLNARGEIIGANRAIQTNAQSISYFSPLVAVRTLADRAEQFHSPTGDSWRTLVVDQIERQEKRSLKLAKPEGRRPQKFADMTFHVPFDADCGQTSFDEDSKLKAKLFVCQGVSLSLLGGDRSALNVTTFASSASAGLGGMASQAASQAMTSRYYDKIKAEYYPGRRKVGAAPIEKCNAKNVRNQNGVSVSVRYCSLQLAKFDGLYATVLKIDHKSKDGTRVSFGQLYEGMTMPATLDLIQYFLDSLEEVDT